jgi:DNA mismatch repair protein MutS2
LRNLGAAGVVSALEEEEAEVQIGVMRVRTRLADLELAGSEKTVSSQANIEPRLQPSTPGAATTKLPESESPGIELDLRGKRADEAEIELERYMDAAFAAGLPYVRIIHGKGTGKLRQVVRNAMQNHPHVGSFQAGGEKEGGDGVTVAKLRT